MPDNQFRPIRPQLPTVKRAPPAAAHIDVPKFHVGLATPAAGAGRRPPQPPKGRIA